MSSLTASPKHVRSMWVKCETPTTGRSYYIHRRTGKISWQQPVETNTEDTETSPVANRKTTAMIDKKTTTIERNTPNCSPLQPSSVSTESSSLSAPAATAPLRDTTLMSPTSNRKTILKLPVRTTSFTVTTLDSMAWTSDETKQLRLFFKRWVHRGQSKVFARWKLFVLYDRLQNLLQAADQKNIQLENSLKMNKAQNELTIEKVKMESWKKAQKDTNIILKRSALRRLKKWMNSYRSDLMHSFKLWVQHTNVHRMLQLNELVSNVECSKANDIELVSLREQYHMDQKEWKQRVARQIELIAGLQNDVEHLQDCRDKLLNKNKEHDELNIRYQNEKMNWMRRFHMQQEVIDRLEHDVEELSELKVLELAENYYDGT
mgnify:CR=1 FL=1